MSAATAVRSEEREADYWDDEDCDPRSNFDLKPLDRLSGADNRIRSHAQDMFDLLADDLECLMLASGSTRRMMRHPAYTEILAMRDEAIPLLLERLGRPGARPLWLRLLGSLTAFQPGAGQRTVPEAAAEWVRWGKLSGHTRVGAK